MARVWSFCARMGGRSASWARMLAWRALEGVRVSGQQTEANGRPPRWQRIRARLRSLPRTREGFGPLQSHASRPRPLRRAARAGGAGQFALNCGRLLHTRARLQTVAAQDAARRRFACTGCAFNEDRMQIYGMRVAAQRARFHKGLPFASAFGLRPLRFPPCGRRRLSAPPKVQLDGRGGR